MRIGYGKIGRVVEMDPLKWGVAGGDNEAPMLLEQMADRHPENTYVCLSRNSGWTPTRANIENPWQDWRSEFTGFMKTYHGGKWDRGDHQHIRDFIVFQDQFMFPEFEKIDGMVVWAGQHSNANGLIPRVTEPGQLTTPLLNALLYASGILRGINYWRREDPLAREEVWLNADVRNYLKARDLKWPMRHPILTQYDYKRRMTNYRYGDPRTPEETGFAEVAKTHATVDGLWKSTVSYKAVDLEVMGVYAAAGTPDWSQRVRFGIIANEALKEVPPAYQRVNVFRDWVLPLQPDFMHGSWSAPSLQKLGVQIAPAPYDAMLTTLQSVKSTLATPTSGSGWPTLKTYEAFAHGVICFMHPLYDDQNHILDPASDLGKWLRVATPEDLKARVDAVHQDRAVYEWLAGEQWRLLMQKKEAAVLHTTIDERLGL